MVHKRRTALEFVLLYKIPTGDVCQSRKDINDYITNPNNSPNENTALTTIVIILEWTAVVENIRGGGGGGANRRMAENGFAPPPP